jgi:hypothetical protein
MSLAILPMFAERLNHRAAREVVRIFMRQELHLGQGGGECGREVYRADRSNNLSLLPARWHAPRPSCRLR